MGYTGDDLLRDIEEWEAKNGPYKMTKEAWARYGLPERRRAL